MLTRLPTLLLVAVALAACGETGLIRESRPATLSQTAWRVVAVDGRTPLPGSEPTALFEVDRVSGSSGCNTYGGHYTYDPATGAISLTDLGMTLMLCAEPEKNAIEAAFTQALGRVSDVSIDPDGRLVLSGAGSEIILAVDAVGG
jgi:heat shock protein HslJ